MLAEWAREAMQTAIDEDETDIRDAATGELGTRIESMIEEMAEEWMGDQASLLADLLNASLKEIDYRDIAEHYISDIKLYFAGWNMPGYMPEDTPAMFADFSAARGYIVEEIERYGEEMEEDERAESDEIATATAIMAAGDARKATGPFSVSCGSYVFWVAEDTR